MPLKVLFGVTTFFRNPTSLLCGDSKMNEVEYPVKTISMKTFWPQHIVVLLFCTISSSELQANAVKCECQAEERNKTRDHLRLITRISSLKLLPGIREIIYQNGAEKAYLLHRASHEIVRDLRANYGNMVSQTDIPPSFNELVGTLKELITDEKQLTSDEIYSVVNGSIEKFHSAILPSAFLCFALGTCRTANAFYMDCMRSNVQHWTIFFGDEPQKMSKKLSDSILAYRRIDRILQSLHNTLLTSEDQITSDCVEQFTNVTACSKCLADEGVGYCSSSCKRVALRCFENLSRNWEESIDELYKLTRKYDGGFQQLVHGIATGVRRLVETKAPNLAKQVVEKCGPLLKENVRPSVSTHARPQKPKELKTRMKDLVEQLHTLRGCWTQIAERTCSGASEQSPCWNGSDIVRVQFADEFSVGTKDVRPRPEETWLESSGHPYDTDDEDFIGGGSGSGMPAEELHDDAAVYTIAPVITSPATSPPTPAVQIEDTTRVFPQTLPWTVLITLVTAFILAH
ncbi:unnamed protein product [Cylicocyclus nassatus]|uniref:Glypican-1 n=1 Tax=Cylicocyclus nassatus TaxID=53992 RepID=A0AA36HGV6_CYLNA|nr:unnamed protein product [Cylicocyclus nassatus]